MADDLPPLSTPAAAGAPSGWQRLCRDRTALAAMAFLLLVLAACFGLPLLLQDARNEPSADTFKAPGSMGTGAVASYPLGTDASGRDLFYRVLAGGRVSLIVGLCAAAFSLGIGTLVGLTAGFAGGRTDGVIMRLVDVLYTLPRVLFALVLIAAMDGPMRSGLDALRSWSGARGWETLRTLTENTLPYSRTVILILCLGLTEWLTMARIVRGQVLVLKEQQFIAAARCLGQSPTRIMFRHLLPNLWTVILTYLTLTIPVVVLDESFLSFLGLGIEEPASSWGMLLKEGASTINTIEPRWWLPVFPALAMSLTLLALNFLGDSLRDALDVH